MKVFKYLLAVFVILAVGIFGSVAVLALSWHLAESWGVPLGKNGWIGVPLAMAIIGAMFWAGSKLASFNDWPLAGQPTLEQLAELHRVDSFLLKVSRIVEVKCQNESHLGYILEVGPNKVMYIELPTYSVLSTFAGDADEEIPSELRPFPSTKIEVHFDTRDRRIRRVDCLGDHLKIEKCFPAIKKQKEFSRNYPRAQIVEQSWDEMKRNVNRLTKRW